jgi:hypothetical protein
MEVAVKNIEGKDTKKKVKLNDETFAIEPNDHAIYLDVKRYMASLRQGTHKAKERAEVNYSTKKIKKQKELVALVRVVLSLLCLLVVVLFSDQDQETMILK